MDRDDPGFEDGPEPGGDRGRGQRRRRRRTGQEGPEEHLEVVSWIEIDFWLWELLHLSLIALIVRGRL